MAADSDEGAGDLAIDTAKWVEFASTTVHGPSVTGCRLLIGLGCNSKDIRIYGANLGQVLGQLQYSVFESFEYNAA